jgi:hypothetical protein
MALYSFYSPSEWVWVTFSVSVLPGQRLAWEILGLDGRVLLALAVAAG